MKVHCVFKDKEMREREREGLEEIFVFVVVVYIRVTKAEEKTKINKRSIQAVTF